MFGRSASEHSLPINNRQVALCDRSTPSGCTLKLLPEAAMKKSQSYWPSRSMVMDRIISTDGLYEKYTSVHRICFQDYRAEYTPCNEWHPEVPHLNAATGDKYLEEMGALAAEGNDVPLRLERALSMVLRYACGFNTDDTGRRMSTEAVLQQLEPVIGPGRFLRGVGLEPMVLVHSLAAYVHYKKYVASVVERKQIATDARKFRRADKRGRAMDPVENLVLSVKHANCAVRMHFVSRAALMAGFAFRALAEALNVDIGVFKQYSPLWSALERRQLELSKEGRALTAVGPASRGECAACGSKRIEGYGLCGGGCAEHLKPVYCSSTCKEKDWASHQNVCEGAGVNEPPPPTVDLLDGMKRHIVIAQLGMTAPLQQIELVSLDEDGASLRNGTVLWGIDSPLPAYARDRPVKYIMKRYE
ncbi:hypothetical protein C8Q78DRAFT_1142808 [Trametes maxima]|nr:hypothetical protein C8Q78DRAFT_1142808 [Trametes maxima]